jgi:hypothetical protein
MNITEHKIRFAFAILAIFSGVAKMRNGVGVEFERGGK